MDVKSEFNLEIRLKKQIPISHQMYFTDMSVEELESVVSKLPPAELSRFSKWFEEFIADQWDRQIEQDELSGRLNDAIKRADDHYKAGRHTPL